MAEFEQTSPPLAAGTDPGRALHWVVTAGSADPGAAEPGPLLIELIGSVVEGNQLATLVGELPPGRGLVLDLAGVRRINSIGVRDWVAFMRTLVGRAVAFRRCSSTVISQLNMIHGFRGHAHIESFMAPYVCDACGHEREYLLDAHGLHGAGRAVPALACPACRSPMCFDDIPDRYLAFLDG